MPIPVGAVQSRPPGLRPGRLDGNAWSGCSTVHTARVTSIVIPAHNEGRVIGRLLDELLADPHASGPDVVVVCNGCTDDTARVAAARGDRVRVVEIPVPSKHAALRAGDEHARGFPRLYVDADVVLGAATCGP